MPDPLKFRVESLDAVPEAHRSFYDSTEDGAYMLRVDGAPLKQKLDEFRNNNIKILKERDTLATKLKAFEDIDPDEYHRLKELEASGSFGKGKGIDPKVIEAEVEKRLGKFRTEAEGKIKAELEARTATERRLAAVLIDNELQRLAVEAGAVETGVDDIVARGRSVFRMVDGKVTPLNGEDVIYGKNGDPLTIKEWLSDLAAKAPHLFKQSKGGGASGGDKGASGKYLIGDRPIRFREDITNAKDKSDFVQQYGTDAYFALPRKAKSA